MSTPTPSDPEPGQSYTPPPAPPYAAPPVYQPPTYPGAAPQYPQAPGYPYGGYAVQKTNTLSILALVGSILGFIWILPFIGSLAGAIMGHISLNQIARSGEKGRGMALAGVIVGWVGVAFIVLVAIVIILGIVASSARTSYGA